MRLRSRPYVHWAPVPGGVYVSGPATEFVLRGPEALSTVCDTVVPLLEAGTTEDALVDALGTERARPAVSMVVDALRRQDLLLPLDRMTAAEPPADVRARHPESLAHLEAGADDPYAAFARLTAATVLVHAPAAVALPAARGLARAGVGRLVLACPRAGHPGEVEALQRAARRLEAAVVEPGGAPLREAEAGVDLVLRASPAVGSPDEGAGEVVPADGPRPGPGAPAVLPVTVADDVHVVGPVVTSVQEADGAERLVARVRAWAGADRLGSLPRPGADGLAGALAGHLAFETLTGVPGSAAAHVVYGEDTESAGLALDLGGAGGPGSSVALEAVDPQPVPGTDEVVDLCDRATRRWTGPFARVTPPTLPQLPVALCVLDRRPGPGLVAGWGWDQPQATLSALLAGLRRDDEAGAAGVTEERWLLDGALRALADAATEGREVPDGEVTPRTVQVRRALAASGEGAVVTEALPVPPTGWFLGRVTRARSGELLGAAWGPTAAEAGEAATAVALARREVHAHVGQDVLGAAPATDLLTTAPAEALAMLRRTLPTGGGPDGVAGVWGGPAGADPALTGLPLRWGGVRTGGQGGTRD